MPRPQSIQPPSRPFEQAWSVADTRAKIASDKAFPSKGTAASMAAWVQSSREINERLQAVLLGHVSLLAQQGRLSLPPHAEAVETRWLSGWKRLLAGTPNPDAIAPFSFSLELHMLARKSPDSEDVEEVEKIHARLVNWVNAGNINWFETGERAECRNSGERLCLKFNAWNPVFGLPQHGNKEEPVRLLGENDIRPPGLGHVAIAAPSGELWIADSVRIAAFTAVAHDAADVGRPSVNTLAGRFAETVRCQELGFAFFSVNNSSPSVVLQEGRLIIGSEQVEEDEDGHYEEADGQCLGRVCTDLWWTTIIDRKVLQDLMATQVGQESAKALVDDYEIEDRDGGGHGLIKVQVPPGTYHLYFAGSPDVFHGQFSSPQVNTQGFDEVMGVLSPDELTLVPKSTSVPGPPAGGRGRRP